jgi:phage terminase small subunit
MAQSRRQGARELNQRQHRFLREFLTDPTSNAGRAYIRAGYRVKNACVASACASRLLNDVRIQAELERCTAQLDQELKAYIQKRKAQRDLVVDRWMNQAFTSIQDLFESDWVLRSNQRIDEATLTAISKLVITPKGVHVDLAARDRALKSLARHLGLFKQPVAPTGRGGEQLPPIEVVRALIREADADAAAAGRSPEPPSGARSGGMSGSCGS